ncbi:MAG: AsmA family protein [Deltaproteobacteria bacterium]|nr:MAG: AsmA family protein [Deltaproteobacteria bacterium]
MRWKLVLGITAILAVALLVTVYLILSSYDYNKLKPHIVRAAKDATGRELRLGGDIDLKIGFSPALVVEDVTFQNAPWGSRPEMAKVNRFEVQVELFPLMRGDIEVKRFVLVEPDILIETDKSGRTNLEFKPGEQKGKKEPVQKEVAEPIKLPTVKLRQISMEKGRLTYKDGKSGETYVVLGQSLRASAKELDGPLQVDLKGAYKENPFRLAGTLGPLDGLTQPDKQWPLNLTLDVGGATVSLDGKIMDVTAPKGIDLAVDAKGRSIPELAGLAGITGLPDIGPFEITLKVSDPAPKAYKISDLKVTFGKSDLGGSAEINLAHKTPKVRANLSSKNLDLRPILANGNEEGKSQESAGQASGRSDRVFSNDPLPFDSLKQLDARVKFQGDRVVLPQMILNNLSFELVMENGRLKTEPVKATIGGADMRGRLELRPRGKRASLATAVQTEKLDLDRMLKELGFSNIVEGKLNVNVELDGRGRSIAELMAGLNGKIVIMMGEGKLNNKYVSLLGGDLTSGVWQVLNPLKGKREYTIANCFVCRLDIKKGIADTTALVFDTSTTSVVGDGYVDLGTEKINLSLDLFPKEGVGTSGVGKVSVSLSELAKPFKLGGTLARPSLAVDPMKSAVTLGKAFGGTALFGPAGVAAVLVQGGSSGENACLAAIETAKKGVKVTEDKQQGKDKTLADKTTKTVEEGVVGVGNTLKKLFGN